MNRIAKGFVVGAITIGFFGGYFTLHHYTHSPMASAMAKEGSIDTSSLSTAFQDELKGFVTIEADVKSQKFQEASILVDQLHDEFHAAIFPLLKEKKGIDYAENIHGKYDELGDAIKGKEISKIENLIGVNRNNLQIVARILGVTL